ncbi:hypothetical protein [Thioclava indica]|uniref:Uncharacterized protein n=1 Tax=Thioclava indica TaxID=1353528 RepID=A0A074K7A8_9RHOB|nr:hypothetical protein [Thioclava indica]KEO57452.1 hypothetical protein DT23_05115 [Thioclava indica]
MFALFLAVTIALALLGWAEFAPRRAGKVAQAQEATDAAQDNDQSDAPKPARRKRVTLALPRFKLPRFKLRLFKRADTSEPDETLSDLSAPDETLSDLSAPVVPLDELREPPREDAAQTAPQTPPVPDDPDADVMARIEAMLEAPEVASETQDDLPRIPNFAPGDQIALEIDGPTPHAREIRFEADPTGRHAIALIADEPILLIENTDPTTLTPAVLSFRAHAA